MEQEQSAYITSLHLKGYKSIRDLSVDLKQGLNIIIGANGSGKTNFLEFLDAAYRSDYESLLNGRPFESVVIMQYSYPRMMKGERVFQNKIKYRVEIDYGHNDKNVYFLNDEKKVVKKEESDDFIIDLTEIKLLRFNNPLNTILNEKISLNLTANDLIYSELNKKTNTTNTFLNTIFDIAFEFNNKTFSTFVKSIIETQPFDIEILKQNLKQFSPIKDFKIDWSLVRETELDEDGEIISSLLDGVDLKFYVNDEWLNWIQLSDGIKRLFYIIGSVAYSNRDGNDIILIEEPELGIHPHQLSLLLDFIKIQSLEKQIIITTHAPEVLNCLKENEIDRIIVARHEGKGGTKMYKLSEKEQKSVQTYMKHQASISDYWLQTGFEKEENKGEVAA